MKFPSYVVNDLGGLANYLLKPPSDEELDARGCLSKEACKKIDTMILDDLQGRLQGYQMPKKPGRGTDPNNRWRTVSSMQKSIRFGMADEAVFAASAAYDMDKAYLLRRLGVTAVEDVGAGSPYAMLATLAVGSSHAWRTVVDERRLMCYLADMQAKSAKDRSLCNFLIIVDFDHSIDKQMMAKMSNLTLQGIIEDVTNPIERRMCAAWIMAGTKRYQGETMPQDNDRSAAHLFEYMVQRGLSRMSLYLAAKTASRIGEAMWISFLFWDEWVRKTKEITILEQTLPVMPKVGKLLGAAYDMHTREGRMAIGKFKKEHGDELMPWFSQIAPKQIDRLLHLGVFCCEGGLLASRVRFRKSEDLQKQTLITEIGSTGLPPAQHPGFMSKLTEMLPKLNACREKVLWAKALN